jgi:hypothetical protein
VVDVFTSVFRLRKDSLFCICYEHVCFNASHDTEIGCLYLVVTRLLSFNSSKCRGTTVRLPLSLLSSCHLTVE